MGPNDTLIHDEGQREDNQVHDRAALGENWVTDWRLLANTE